MLQKHLVEILHIDAGQIGFLQNDEARTGILIQDSFGQSEKVLPCGKPQAFLDIGIFDIQSCVGNHLIENTLRVTHAAIARFGNPGKSNRTDVDAFLGSDQFQIGNDFFQRYAAKIVALTTGKNRGRNFVALGRGENKNDMRRRLFQCFQERVEGRIG